MEKQKNVWKVCKDEMLETTDKKEIMNWLRKADLKVEMLCSAQEQAI